MPKFVTGEDENPSIVLALEVASSDRVHVKARLAGSGRWFYILTFKSDGTVDRVGWVDPRLGFKIDSEQKLDIR